MKKIVYLLVIIGTIFTGCDPMDDIYKDIDAQSNPIIGNAEYTLTSDDYDALELSFGSFDSEDQAKELLPDFIADMYPYWGAGSSVTIGYNLYIGAAEDVSDYTNAAEYELQYTDYPTAESGAFFPNEEPSNFIGDILSAQITDPVEGQVVFVEYDQFDDEPEVGYANIPEFDYNFNGDFNGWTVTDVLGDQGWTAQADYAEGNGYESGQFANEDWLISPSIDLSSETDITFQINQAINYAADLSLLQILVATDYTGDHTTATWNEINLTTTPAGNNNDFILSEEYDFNAYLGQTINIALKYESTDSDAARWRVDELAIKRIGIAGETTTYKNYYTYIGSSWEMSEGVYYLTAEDYDSMGEASGQPGRYDNFSDTAEPEDYLPTFLNIKYPFAQEEDSMIVIYKYYDGSDTLTEGNLYTVVNGVWVAHESVVETTLKFGFENGMWVPDNTIRYSLMGSDYTYISTEFAQVDGFEDAAASMANYGNFDRREGRDEYWSNDMIIEAMNALLNNVVNPNAEEGQKYLLTFDVYNGSNTTEDIKLIKEAGEWVLFTE